MNRNYSKFDRKFRAWDELKNKMIYDIHVLKKMAYYYGFCGGSIKVGARNGYPIIMESIGVEDKNGKDIFELDVVQRHDIVNDDFNRLGVVVRGELRYGIFDGMMVLFGNDVYEFSRCEIIGTIFDDQHKYLYEKVKAVLGL